MVTGKTKVTGIFGYPVEHSLSPAMHNAAFQSLSLDYIYVPFLIEPGNLADATKAIRDLTLRGINVTIPHKEEVIKYLDELTPEAQLIGAVNTIVNTGEKLIGHNTDGAGFVRSLQEEVVIPGINVFIIGAGGAARAVAVQLSLSGAKSINIFVREADISRAESIAKVVNNCSTTTAEVRNLADRVELGVKAPVVLINCTPLGMYPEVNVVPPFELTSLPKGSVVCDLIYNPLKTLFLRRAEELGLKIVHGAGMLLYQGALAFELWTGRPAPVEVMKKALGLKF